MGTGSTVGTGVGAIGGAAAGSYLGPVGTVAGGYIGGKIGGWVGGLFDSSSGPNQTDLAKSQVAQPNANAQLTYEQALALAAATQQGEAPATIGPAMISAGQLDPNRYDTLINPNATAVDATGTMRGYSAALADAATAQATRAGVTRAAQVAPATVDQVNTTVTPSYLGPAAQAGGVQVQGVQVDPLASELRAEQIAAANNIASAPSAADAQFKASQGQIVADQLSMAAQARGAERAGARREAMIAAGQQGQTAALAASALAAKEEQDKRVAAATALQGIRSQDVTASLLQANIDAQRSTLQAQLDTAVAQGNRDAINTIKEQQAQLEMDARKATLSGNLSQQSTLAGLETANLQARQQTELTNTGAENAASTGYANALNAASAQNAQNKTNVSVVNAGAQTEAAKTLATAQNAAGQQYAQNATQTNQQNTTNALTQATNNANRGLTAATTNQQNALDASKFNATNYLTTQQANVGNQLTYQNQTAQNTANALNVGNNAANIQATNARTVTDANKSQASTDQANTGALIGAAGSIAAAYAGKSDERVKDDIAPIGGGHREFSYANYAGDDKEEAKRAADGMTGEDVQDWAAHLQPITFRYKPGQEDGGAEPKIGLSANRVEQSGPLGKLMVSRDQDGIRHLDYGAATLMLAKAAFDKASEAYEAALARKGAR